MASSLHLEKLHALTRAGDFAAAAELAQRLLRAEPNSAYLTGKLAELRSLLGQPKIAIELARRAVELSGRGGPGRGEERAAELLPAAAALSNSGKAYEALPVLILAAAVDPSPTTLCQLASTFLVLGRLVEAEAEARLALEKDPDNRAAVVRASSALLERGRSAEARALLLDLADKLLHASAREDAGLLEMAATAANYSSDSDGPMQRRLAERLASAWAAEPPPAPVPGANASGNAASSPRRWHPGQRLSIGLLCADAYEHSVARFLLSMLPHLCQRADVTLYSTGRSLPAGDHMTRALAAAVGHARFVDATRWNDAGTADRLADGGEGGHHVILETSGLTAGHRIRAVRLLAARGVPIVTWLGYPATTGLTGIYRLVDHQTDPQSDHQTDGPKQATTALSDAPPDTWHSEQLVRLPGCFVCYTPPSTDDHRLPPPRDPSSPDPVRFGSFNNLAKLSEACVDLFAAALRATPGSTLLLKHASLGDELVRTEVAQRFAKRGIDPARLTLLGRSPTATEHLASYGKIDIALDSTPYSGTTTTCEALFMGRPVITLAPPISAASGPNGLATGHHASRVGASLLTHTKTPELIASTPEHFASIASTLAADGPRLTRYHQSLRGQLMASRLCDGARFAAHLATTLEHIAAAHAASRQ